MSPSPVRIKLTTAEMLQAVVGGGLRRIQNLVGRERGVKKGDRCVTPEDGWGSDIESVMAEIVIGKLTGRHWSKGRTGDPDVGPYEVRSTTWSNGGLMLHEWDHDKKPYILVCGADGRYMVWGWLFAIEGKKKEYWRPKIKKPAFIVPQRNMRDIATLKLDEVDTVGATLAALYKTVRA